MTTLQTNRLIGRRPKAIDFAAIFQIYSDERIIALSPIRPFESLDEAVQLLSSWDQHLRQFGYGPWLIATRERPAEIIGIVGLTLRDFDGHMLPNLWYRFIPDAWGKGYATEIAKALLEFVAASTDLKEVHAHVLEANLASIHVLEKLGMAPFDSYLNRSTGEYSTRYRLILQRA